MNRRKWVSIAVLALFVIGTALIAIFAGERLIEFVQDTDKLRAWVNDNQWGARLGFIGMVIFQLIVAVIPGEPIEFAAGFAFGAVEGAVLCLVGCFFGAWIVFTLVRRFGVKLVETFFPIEKINEMKFLHDSKRLNFLVFILFFIPGTPKDLLTYAAGLTTVNMWTYLLISNLARIPSVISSTIAGSAAMEQDYMFLVIVYGITAAVSLVGIVIYRRIQKSHETKESTQ